MIRPRASPTSGWVSIWRTAARHSRYGAAQVDGHHRVPVLRLGVQQRLGVRPGQHGVVHEHVQRAGALHRRRDQPIAVVRRGNVGIATCTALPPQAMITSSVGSPPVIGSRRMSASRTSNPSAASRIAIARPMPEDGPGDDGAAHAHLPHLPVPILPRCPALHSSPTACSTRTRRPTAAPAAPASTRRWSRSCARSGWRIEQMPCPELAFTGLNRFWAVKEQLDTTAFRRHCRRIAAAVSGAIEVHVERGDDVILVGIEGSPSMGVHITSSDPEPRRPAGVAGRRRGALARQRHLHGGADRRAGRARHHRAARDGHLAPAARLRSRRGTGRSWPR